MVNAGNVFSKLLDYKDFNMSITLDEEVKKLTNEYNLSTMNKDLKHQVFLRLYGICKMNGKLPLKRMN